MFGVVLWSSREVLNAVIWCEDHGDLAFLDETGGDGETQGLPEPGDLVRFEIQWDSTVRRARNASVVSPELYPNLVAALTGSCATSMPHACTHGNRVLPFRQPQATQKRTGEHHSGSLSATGG